jgi:hypothetical protein
MIVPAWELAVLQAIHEEVTVLRDVTVERDPPSVAGEFNRLLARYGAERKEGGFTGIPYVESVFGQHAIGRNALKDVMQGSVLLSSTPVTPTDPAPVLRQDLLKALTETSSDITDLIGSDEPEEIEVD